MTFSVHGKLGPLRRRASKSSQLLLRPRPDQVVELRSCGKTASKIDWLEEQYVIDRREVLNPKDYKKWRDEVFLYGGPETYIDYLVETGKLKIPEEKLSPEDESDNED